MTKRQSFLMYFRSVIALWWAMAATVIIFQPGKDIVFRILMGISALCGCSAALSGVIAIATDKSGHRQEGDT